MTTKKIELVDLPDSVFGPGFEIDFKRSRVVGSDGSVWEHCLVSREGIERLCDGEQVKVRIVGQRQHN